jgi:valyl-tRNA synthetase
MNPDAYDRKIVETTSWTLAHVGIRILQMYAPFVPHVTETLYQLLYKEKCKTISVHQTKFATYQKPYEFSNASKTMETLVALIGQVRKLKTEKQLSLKTELASLKVIVTDAALPEQLQALSGLIKGVTKAQELTFISDKVTETSMVQDQTQWHATISV